MWKASVKDVNGEILCVSQFTLMANTNKHKPDFHRAMVGSRFFGSAQVYNFDAPCYKSTEPSRELYATFLENLRRSYLPDKIKGKLQKHTSCSDSHIISDRWAFRCNDECQPHK